MTNRKMKKRYYHFSQFFTQANYRSPLLSLDILIHFGEVSGDLARVATGGTLHVSEDGQLRNTFSNLTRIFEMPESFFFRAYTPEKYETCNNGKTINARWK